MAVNYLHVSAVSTVASFVGLQWWAFSYFDAVKSDGLGEGESAVELVLGSNVTVAFLVLFVINVFLLVVLSLKTLFFVQLYPSETQKVLERIVNYVILKGIFLPLAVPPNTSQVILWSTWLVILCSLKLFQSFARDRLERLNASPMVTPSKYFRVFSALLFVLSADFLWIALCVIIYRSLSSSLFLLLFFEPLCIAFETLQAVMVHGFQLADIWQRHSNDSTDSSGSQDSYKSAAGSLNEWKGVLIRNYGFLLDIMTLFMALGHYLIIWWLHGMSFHLVDALLFVNLRALVSAIVKRVRGYVKLQRALGSLNGALPDATFEEICAFNDECAICREPMAKAKRLACSHLFHLACLKSWLDQGLSEVYSCPTCRRPLFLSNTQNRTSSVPELISNNEQLNQQAHLGLVQQRIAGHQLPAAAFPNQQHNPSDTVWRGVGLDPSWMPAWPNPGLDGAGPSSAIRSVGLSGVQMMMRQLASVSENYAHSSLDDTARNFWHSGHASGSSAPPSSLPRYNGTVSGLRLRSTPPPAGGITPSILAMADRVREVLPHIPDELIIQDLLRTNNINITVNNLLLVQ